jgi:hypothetical protein
VHPSGRFGVVNPGLRAADPICGDVRFKVRKNAKFSDFQESFIKVAPAVPKKWQYLPLALTIFKMEVYAYMARVFRANFVRQLFQVLMRSIPSISTREQTYLICLCEFSRNPIADRLGLELA